VLANTTVALFPRLAARPLGRFPSTSSPLFNSPPSIYRPFVQAQDRLAYWHSPSSIHSRLGLMLAAHPSNLAQLDKLTESSLKSSTLSTYGSGLAHWIAWCDQRGLSENHRLPASSLHLSLFLAYMSLSHSKSVISNTMTALRHWHELHNLKWEGDIPYIRKVRHAAILAAPSSVRPPRPPVTTSHLSTLRDGLDFRNSFDSAVFAVACTTFWGVWRLGELTVPSLSSFDPQFHVTRGTRVRREANSEGSPLSVTFHLPWSKTTRLLGADIILTFNSEWTCPGVALEHHLLANSEVPLEHGLFSYMHEGRPKYMVKATFLCRCASIWEAAGLDMVQGHSFRIGGTTEYLRRGLPVDFIMIQGRWTSEAFKLYLRKLDVILSAAIVSVSPELRARVKDAIRS
jgi:hypothetical protein